MTLRIPDPPPESRAAAQAGLDLLAGRGRVRTRALLTAGPDELRLTAPHQVYALGLADLQAGLSAARPVAWRYLVEHDSGPVALAETVGDDHGFSQLNYGPFVAGTAEALPIAEGLPGDGELRLLHVPAVHLVAIWRHGDDGDTLIPVAPSPGDVDANRPYPAGDLLSQVGADLADDVGIDDGRGG